MMKQKSPTSLDNSVADQINTLIFSVLLSFHSHVRILVTTI